MDQLLLQQATNRSQQENIALLTRRLAALEKRIAKVEKEASMSNDQLAEWLKNHIDELIEAVWYANHYNRLANHDDLEVQLREIKEALK